MKNYLTLFLLLIGLTLSSQNNANSTKLKTAPILYTSILGGWSGGHEVEGLTLSVDLNYQINKDLFTFRTLHIAEKNNDVNFFEALLIIPIFSGGDSVNEYALLYGKRFIFNSSALSFSAGISSNLIKYTNNTSIKVRDTYVGIPWEVNWHLFKGRKKRFRLLYGIIPVGKPTSFGRNIGVKLYGNIGKFNYIGIGITSGIGWHKKY